MKARLFVLCCALLLLTGFTGSAQEELLAKGVLMNKATKMRIALAEVTNLRTGYTVGSNDMGFFQLKALPGDTLLVQKHNFSEVKVAVTSEKDVLIYMMPTVTTIDEIVINGQSKKAQLEDMKRDYRNKGAFYDGKPPLLAYVFHPLTSIYSLFGREPKNARRFGRYYANEMQQTKIDALYNEVVVEQQTGLKGEALGKFMVDFRPDYKTAERWNNYDAIRYIQASFKKYSDTAGKK